MWLPTRAREPLDWALFSFAEPDGNTWAVPQLKARREKPLIPRDHLGLFGTGLEF